jgi:uncharacterized membrane protein YfcA
LHGLSLIEVPVVGLVVGFLLGLTSLGGGSLLTPVLILVLRVHPVVAVGSDLVCQAATRLAGLPVHIRQGSIDRRLLTLVACGSVPGALTGSGLAASLHPNAGDRVVLTALGVMLVVTALALAFEPLTHRLRKRAHQKRQGATALRAWRRGGMVVGGFIIGVSVGLTSVGAGSLLVVLLVALSPGLSTRRLIGTDLAHGVVLLPLTGLLALGAGHVDLTLVGLLLIGSVPGVLLGSRASSRLPERPLRLTVAGMVLYTGLRLAGI